MGKSLKEMECHLQQQSPPSVNHEIHTHHKRT